MSVARTFAQKLAKSKRDARYRARHYSEITRKRREKILTSDLMKRVKHMEGA